MQNTERLLSLYRKLWQNRSLPTVSETSEETLQKAIIIELMDELTHPRTRKKPLDKYFLAVKRITTSSLEPADQVLLIREFTNRMDELKRME